MTVAPSTPSDVRSTDRLRSRLQDHDLVLPSFTDEELAALQPEGPRLVPLVAFDSLEPAARRAALGAARRALLAQQHLVTGEPGDVRTAGPLRVVHALRSRPAHLLVARAGTDWRWCYGLGRVAVLEERFDGDIPGVHRFVLRAPARQAQALADWCDAAQPADVELVVVSAPAAPGEACGERRVTIRGRPGAGFDVTASDGQRHVDGTLAARALVPLLRAALCPPVRAD
jgi:hypothetical protein